MLVFNSRARQAAIIRLKLESGDAAPLAQVSAEVRAQLIENRLVDGLYEKLTLAIGGGEEKAEL